MKKGVLTIFVLIMYLMSADVSAKRILFYENGAGGTIEGDYSKLADELRKKNYEVASIEKGELSKEKLENYDILVMTDMGKQLSTGEISAIIWFVLQKGRGLFINGGGQGKANQLSIPFGVTVDSGILIDSTNMIPALKDRNMFIINDFQDSPVTSTLKNGVTKIGFYKDAPLILSGSTRCVAHASTNAYTDTGSFSAGSSPCIAAASIFGQGLVFTLSSSAMLSNKYITDFNNKNFGMNIIDWLSISSDNLQEGNDSSVELHIQIKEMRLENIRLQQENKDCQEEKTDATNRFNQASLQISDLQNSIQTIQSGMIGPFNRTNWAVIALGVCILLAAVVYSKKKGGGIGGADVKIKDEDILNELGYELDGASGGGTPPAPPKK